MPHPTISSLVEVPNIKEFSFHRDDEKIAHFITGTYKAEGPIGSTRKTRVASLFLFDKGAVLNLKYTSIALPPWRSGFHRLMFLLLQTASRMSVYLKPVVLLHIRIGDLTISLWSGLANYISVDIITGIFLHE